MSIGITADVLVIGFGKGGKDLAGTLGRAGKRVVMVEQSDRMYGGTCVNIGCVPTKALVHHADLRRPDDDPHSWYQDAIGAVTDLTTMTRRRNFQMLDTLDTVTVVTGRASFLDATTVEVAAGADRLTVSAATIVINTGSVPVVPDIRGLRGSAYMATSTDLLHTEELPRHLAVIGGGYLGLEFAAISGNHARQRREGDRGQGRLRRHHGLLRGRRASAGPEGGQDPRRHRTRSRHRGTRPRPSGHPHHRTWRRRGG